MNKRIITIDILRGITIFAMILCANIGYYSELPAWMFHCQTPPPTYAFNPDVPGITWVDLVFPFFLFTMGAAFPLAMRKRLENGVSKWSVAGSLFKRWLTLTNLYSATVTRQEQANVLLFLNSFSTFRFGE